MHAAILLAAQLAASAPAAAPPTATEPAPSVRFATLAGVQRAFGMGPGSHMRLVEAYAAPDVEKRTPTVIAAQSAAQRDDPLFKRVKARMEADLAAEGFNMAPIGSRFLNAVVIDMELGRDIFGEQPGQGTDNPAVLQLSGPARLPSYRRITVASYDLRDRAHPRLLWRTVVQEDGFDFSPDRTLPPLAEAGGKYLARSVTRLGVADCSDTSMTLGSHIPSRPCGAVRAVLERPFVVRHPQVTAEPADPAEPRPR